MGLEWGIILRIIQRVNIVLFLSDFTQFVLIFRNGFCLFCFSNILRHVKTLRLAQAAGIG